MFDKNISKIFQELDRSGVSLGQADDSVNYYNIFLSVKCLKELDPSLIIPEILLSNLDENFNRILMNCLNSFLQELYVVELSSSKIYSVSLPFFTWQSEYSKSLLPASMITSSIENLEEACKLISVVIFYSLQYIADFVKLCVFLEDDASLKTNLK